MFDAVRKRVLEALDPYRASGADVLRGVDAGTIGGEEDRTVRAPASGLRRPFVSVWRLVHDASSHRGVTRPVQARNRGCLDETGTPPLVGSPGQPAMVPAIA